MKSISSIAFGLVVFDLRSGLNVERVFSGPTYPRSQMLETYIRVNYHSVLASKFKRKPYLPRCGRTEIPPC